MLFVLLVFFSSTSFMVGVHLCGGHVQNVALFTKAAVCEMEKQLPPCHKQESKSCCDDEKIVHDGQSFKIAATDISFTSVAAVEMALPHVLIAELIPSSITTGIQHHNYDPPPRAADLTVSLQVFLI